MEINADSFCGCYHSLNHWPLSPRLGEPITPFNSFIYRKLSLRNLNNGFMDEEKETSVLLRVLCGGKLNQKDYDNQTTLRFSGKQDRKNQ